MERLPSTPQAVDFLGPGPVLVLALHPGDEVLGCGGALLTHGAAGDQVRVLILGDSAAGVGAEDDASQYHTGSRAAAQVLGYGVPEFWNLSDQALAYGEPLVRRILAAVAKWNVRLLYAPSLYERHPAHRVTAMVALEVLRRIGGALRLAMYELAVPLHPNRLLDISASLDTKRRASACFSACPERDGEARSVLALNEFRARELSRCARAAEAYLLLEAATEARDLANLYAPEFVRQRHLGLAMDAGKQPLVTLIVRSTGRPELAQALDSIALQTYPRIEVCLVSARGGGFEGFGDLCGRFPLRVVDLGVPLSRARAANAGLAQARGTYLMFLDDDDWIDPDHVAVLADTLDAQGGQVAYSGVRCVYEHGTQGQAVFNESFDPTRLLAGNYIPIHAVLFSRRLVEQGGCCFDAELEIYEDWDFWIQMSRLAPFIHVDRLSAHYRITPNAGLGVLASPGVAEAAALRLYEKWRPRWNGDELTSLMAYARQRADALPLPALLAEKEQELAELKQQLGLGKRELEARLESKAQERIAQQEQTQHLTQTLHAREAELAFIRASRPYRLYRAARRPWRMARRFWPYVLRALREPRQGMALLGLTWRLWCQGGVQALREALAAGELRRALTPPPEHYAAWIAAYEDASAGTWRRLAAQARTLAEPPRISLILPTFNSPEPFLREAIDSVLGQAYPHWELCIADDASPDPRLRQVLEEYAAREPRIRLLFRQRNGHIAAASNSALALANGDFVAFLDHDDRLAPLALCWVAQTILAHPEAQILYSDEDKLDAQGHRYDPYFKSDWNPDLFRSQNLISHLGVYRRSLVESLGGFREGFDGSQDYDLALRAVERLDPRQILHIPRVLYHWRALPSSTASTPEAKPYAQTAALRALQEHLDRLGEIGEAVPSEEAPGMYRVRYGLPADPPHVTLIILTRNQEALLRQCVESLIRKTDYPAFDILILDNGSDEPATLAYLRDLAAMDQVSLLRDPGPFNFSALNNQAVRQAQGPFVCLLNNDTEVIDGAWLREMMSHAVRPGVGAVGARLWYPDNRLQHGGVILGLGGVANHAHKGLPKGAPGYFGRAVLTQNLSALTGACLLLRKALYVQVGGLDAAQLPVAFNDIDLCLRIGAQGYRLVWTPYAQLYHHESVSRGYEDTPEKWARFRSEVEAMQRRWGQRLFQDPAYNPNLTLEREDFSLGWPPRVLQGGEFAMASGG